VRAADQIIVLDAGVIVERGTHRALLEAGGLYARLSREQDLEEQLEGELAVGGATA
jgi:ABC-type multidrug transport system fused ATPase/permease subunit